MYKIIPLLVFSALMLKLNDAFVSQDLISFQDKGYDYSEFIQAQKEIGSDPSQYFLCGYSLRKMFWEKRLYTCNCGNTPQGWRCEQCPNTFGTKTNAFKAIFCHYTDWNKQLIQSFTAGNVKSGPWREIKCPKNQYATRASVRIATQLDEFVGLNGMQLKCQNIFLNQSTLIQDYGVNDLRDQTLNQQGTFISAIRIQYIPDDKITGILFSFQYMTSISRIQIVFNTPDKLSSSEVIIDSTEFSNLAQNFTSKVVALSKNFTVKNIFLNSISYTNSYLIAPGVSVTAPSLDSSFIERSDQTSQAFAFMKQFKTTTFPTKQIQITAPACTTVKVSSTIQQLPVKLGYEAVLYFTKFYNDEPLGNMTVKGVWNGLMTSASKTSLSQQAIVGCVVNKTPKVLVASGDVNTVISDGTLTVSTSPHLSGLKFPQPTAKWVWNQNFNSAPFGQTLTFLNRFRITSKNKKLTLYITADDTFKAYINGKFILSGDYYPKVFSQVYDDYPLNQDGINILEVVAKNGPGAAAVIYALIESD